MEARVRGGPVSAPGMRRFAIDSLEALTAAVHAARPDCGWSASQFSPGRVTGSVVHEEGPHLAWTSTRVQGDFEMQGALSNEGLTFTLGLDLSPATRQWLRPVSDRQAMVVAPRDAVDARVVGRNLYLTIVMPPASLLAAAEREGVRLADPRLGRTGVLARRMAPEAKARLAALMHRLHDGLPPPPGPAIDALLLPLLLELASGEVERPGVDGLPNAGRVVARAREHIHAHLDTALSVDSIAAAAFTSRRTLHRAFLEVLGETPQAYVLKLRLNRIRRDLATPAEAARTVTLISMQWGMPELGRMAARYRAQFGELPSETLARRGQAPAPA